MKPYLDLLREVLSKGERRPDRTGTGTLSLFGTHSRYDLRDGFPLVTTKKINFSLVVRELLWFLSGSTNVNDLVGAEQLWRPWATKEGELGPVYGKQFKAWGAVHKPVVRAQPEPNMREGVKRRYLGVGNGAGSTKSMFGKTWEGMMSRCYAPHAISYPMYGAKGVYVCDRWLEFAAFAEDAPLLPGFDHHRFDQLYLDKDISRNGFYGPGCRWISASENCTVNNTKVYVLNKNGVEYKFDNVTEFCSSQGIIAGNLSDLWTGKKNAKVRHGFKLVRVEDRARGVDQISQVLASIKADPNGRRHIVSAWNVSDITEMALPPCHVLHQYYVSSDGHLDMQMYQRSADLAIGVPFNIASYALLLSMVARECLLTPRYLVHCIGDAHIYQNHISGVEEQLKREPRELPLLALSGHEVLNFKEHDISLSYYDPHPFIKFEVAV